MRLALRRPPAALLAVLLGALPLAACDTGSTTEPVVDPREGVTRVLLTLLPEDGAKPVTASATDPDRNGLDIQYLPLALTAGARYTGTVALFAADKDVTAAVRAAGTVHQVFFTPAGGAAGRVTVTRTEQDANGLPLGLAFTVAASAGAAASGTLSVEISHYASSKQLNRPSDTPDFRAVFPVTIAVAPTGGGGL